MSLPNELLPGKTYSVTKIDDNKEKISILCDSIEQRNWSRVALGRFADGPDIDLLQETNKYIDRGAIKAELALQKSFRPSQFHASSKLEYATKKLGIGILGKKYLKKLEDWYVTST